MKNELEEKIDIVIEIIVRTHVNTKVYQKFHQFKRWDDFARVRKVRKTSIIS